MLRRSFLLAVLGAASCLPLPAGAAGEPSVSVKHSIDMETPPGRVLVELSFINQGRTTVWIPRELAAGDALTGARFDVRDAGGKPVRYTGRMVKRAAPTGADYQPLEPGKTLTNTIDITNAYAFAAGRHNYHLGYAGPVLADLQQIDKPLEFPARPVSFIANLQ